MEREKIFEVIVGVLVLVVAGLFFYVSYSRTTIPTSGVYNLRAFFDKVDGLAVGSDVRISGIKVGSVTELSVDADNFMAVVDFSIADRFKLPKDSAANISSDGLFGGKHLSITPGGQIDVLSPGETIDNTTGSMNLESLVSKFIFSSKEGAA